MNTKAIIITTALFTTVVALSGCSSAAIQQADEPRLARVEACQQAGGVYEWQSGYKRCSLGNEMLAKHNAGVPVVIETKMAAVSKRAR